MRKRILATILGIITAFIVIMLLENLWKVIYPPPTGFNMEDKASWGKLMQSMPPGALWCLVLGYATGSFAGGWVAARIATERKRRAALIVGIVVMAGGVWNLVEIPHPLWFVIISNVAYIPFAYLGGKVALKSVWTS